MTMLDVDEATVELRAMQAAWRGLRSHWQLSEREVEELLPDGCGEHGNPNSGTETRMRLLLEISYRLPHRTDAVSDWLRLATPQFGWLTPLEAMSSGLPELRQVRRIVEQGGRL